MKKNFKMTKEKRIDDLMETYFGDPTSKCTECGQEVYTICIPELGVKIPEISDEPIYAPVEYLYDTPTSSCQVGKRDVHECCPARLRVW